MILVERYFSQDELEIVVHLPQGESYIHSPRNEIEDSYDISVLLLWYGRKFFTGVDYTITDEDIDFEELQEIANAPTYDLIAIIRRALPTIKQLNIDADKEI